MVLRLREWVIAISLVGLVSQDTIFCSSDPLNILLLTLSFVLLFSLLHVFHHELVFAFSFPLIGLCLFLLFLKLLLVFLFRVLVEFRFLRRDDLVAWIVSTRVGRCCLLRLLLLEATAWPRGILRDSTAWPRWLLSLLWLDKGLCQCLRVSKDHMLLVENSVRKFILECLLLQELLDPHSDKRLSENLIDSWPPMDIDSQHLVNKLPQLP